MKVHVPYHLTAEWTGQEMSRRRQVREAGRSIKTNYIHPKPFSIREHIALAEKLKRNL